MKQSILAKDKGFSYYLAESLDDLKRFVKKFPVEGYHAIDIETSGLNTAIDAIAGFSISTVEGSAIYVPVGHRVGINVPIEGISELLYSLDESSIPVFL